MHAGQAALDLGGLVGQLLGLVDDLLERLRNVGRAGLAVDVGEDAVLRVGTLESGKVGLIARHCNDSCQKKSLV